jgi:formylmethanofuran dehydrogenase subunit A
VAERLRIAGARVYDPLNGVDGEVRDLCIEDGRIVASLPPDAPTFDARGLVAFPGGVDIHAHIAGPTVNLARKLQPEDHRADPHPRRGPFRSGTGGTVPSTWTTGYRYAALGYTTVMEAAVAPSGARSAHAELRATPVIDRGLYVLAGNHELLLRAIARGEAGRVRDLVAWLVRAAKAYAIKVVNPGGVAVWKSRRGDVRDLDAEVDGLGVTPRRIVQALAAAATELRLPHPPHIHCTHLGLPGNAAVTLETMRAVEGHRAHFTHLQFHAYGGEPGGRPTSRARDLVEYVNAHPEITVDVGQVLFGLATAMTADGPVGHLLHRITGRKWVNWDVELETGCGIVPLEYRDRNAIHALQWAIGLEIFLLAEDLWRVALSTDHPNGASFVAYPRLIRLLMDPAFRDEEIRRANAKGIRGTALADGLDRAYSLYEVAIVTRAAPAKILGVHDRKGHLGPGADADITLYADDPDREAMFAAPRHVWKGGVRVVADGELCAETYGRTLRVAPEADAGVEREVREFLERYGTLRPEHAVVGDDEVDGADEEGEA